MRSGARSLPARPPPQPRPPPRASERRVDRGPDRARRRALAAACVLFFGSAIAAAAGGAAVVAAIVIAVGAMLIVAAFNGGARWLIVPALLMAFPAGVVAAADVDLDGGVGEREYRPTSTADVRERYELGMGRLEIDLRDANLPRGDTPLQVDLGVGEAVVVVPAQRLRGARHTRRRRLRAPARPRQRAAWTSIGTRCPRRRRRAAPPDRRGCRDGRRCRSSTIPRTPAITRAKASSSLQSAARASEERNGSL